MLSAVRLESRVVDELSKIHFGVVGVEEKGSDAGWLGCVVLVRSDFSCDIIFCCVVLYHCPSPEDPFFILVAYGADPSANAVVGVPEYNGGRHECFLIALAQSALAEYWVILVWTKYVVIGS